MYIYFKRPFALSVYLPNIRSKKHIFLAKCIHLAPLNRTKSKFLFLFSDLKYITLVITALALVFLTTTTVFNLEDLYSQIREIADKAHKESHLSFANKIFFSGK